MAVLLPDPFEALFKFQQGLDAFRTSDWLQVRSKREWLLSAFVSAPSTYRQYAEAVPDQNFVDRRWRELQPGEDDVARCTVA
jgi:hypothetical protein